MATLRIAGDRLVVSLTLFEKVAGLIGDQDVPLAAITSVTVEPRPLDAARGLRAPGLGVPGRWKIGTWRRGGSRHFVRVRRGEPGVDITAAGQRFDRYLISHPDAEQIVARIRAALPPGG